MSFTWQITITVQNIFSVCGGNTVVVHVAVVALMMSLVLKLLLLVLRLLWRIWLCGFIHRLVKIAKRSQQVLFSRVEAVGIDSTILAVVIDLMLIHARLNATVIVAQIAVVAIVRILIMGKLMLIRLMLLDLAMVTLTRLTVAGQVCRQSAHCDRLVQVLILSLNETIID